MMAGWVRRCISNTSFLHASLGGGGGGMGLHTHTHTQHAAQAYSRHHTHNKRSSESTTMTPFHTRPHSPHRSFAGTSFIWMTFMTYCFISRSCRTRNTWGQRAKKVMRISGLRGRPAARGGAGACVTLPKEPFPMARMTR